MDESEDATVGSVNEDQPGAAPHSGATERPWRWLRVAAAVQGIAIAGLLTALWWQSHETLVAPRFTTLSTHPAVPRGPVLRVVFAKDIALDEVGDMLRSIDAQIVAGPSDAGVYTLALAESQVDPAATQAALLRLRADQRLLFAEQAVARSGPP